jgi:hypothetical protein
MEDLLIQIIEKAFGFPVMLQGSLLPEQPYPDNFFTYWNDSADGTSFYGNNESEILWQYSLNFYSINPVSVNSILLEAKPILKAAGFIVTGAGYSVASDEPTHTGRGITVRYRQRV